MLRISHVTWCCQAWWCVTFKLVAVFNYPFNNPKTLMNCIGIVIYVSHTAFTSLIFSYIFNSKVSVKKLIICDMVNFLSDEFEVHG